jgi:hypothetical protein
MHHERLRRITEPDSGSAADVARELAMANFHQKPKGCSGLKLINH